MKTAKKTKKRKIKNDDIRDICKNMLEVVLHNSKIIDMSHDDVIRILANLAVSFTASVCVDEDEFQGVSARIMAEIHGLTMAYLASDSFGPMTAH